MRERRSGRERRAERGKGGSRDDDLDDRWRESVERGPMQENLEACAEFVAIKSGPATNVNGGASYRTATQMHRKHQKITGGR